ncbi:MAG: pyridoxal phosphate-dependent aminotransferase [Candidatus Nealsonbacteria bacterium]|nr:pyridoxal phosphate-dependent aminotransferase [Candidatus Nealsonbacteria bacterium]
MPKFALSGAVRSIEPSPTFEIEAKVKEMQKNGAKVFNLNLGEPDFFTSDNVKSAALIAIVENKTRYTQVKGMPKLLEAVCEKFKSDNGLVYTPKEVIVSNGAKQILYLAIRTVCEVGDEVIVLAPYWVSYPEITKLAGGKPVIVKTDDFRFSAEAIRKAITRKTKAIVINSPNNPTSIVWTKDELEELGKLVMKYRILVISDEIYERFLFDGAKHFSFAAMAPKLKNYTITVNGVSKTYAMTGFRVGYAGGPAYIIEKMADLQSHVSSSICSISQEAAVEALSGGKELVNKMVREFDERRKLVCDDLRNLGVEFIKPEGAYYVFFKVEPHFDSMHFCEILLQDFKVALNPGESFGTPGWVRLSYTVNRDDLKEAMYRIGMMFRRG